MRVFLEECSGSAPSLVRIRLARRNRADAFALLCERAARPPMFVFGAESERAGQVAVPHRQMDPLDEIELGTGIIQLAWRWHGRHRGGRRLGARRLRLRIR
jgi:hypothetical protein